MKFIEQLKSMGLTNTHAEDFGVLASASPTREYKCYCQSIKCATIEKPRRQKSGRVTVLRRIGPMVLKHTGRTPKNNCDDCGSSLIIK